MTKVTTTPRKSRKAKTSTKAAAPETQAAPKHPGGKLGQVVEQLETADGAMLSELVTLTGWQRHTIRGALSRLRRRGFAIRLEDRNGRKAYRLDPLTKPHETGAAS